MDRVDHVPQRSDKQQAAALPRASGGWIAWRTEWFALRHSLLPWLVVCLPVLAALLRLVGARFQSVAMSARGGFGADAGAADNWGYGYWVDSVSTGLILVYILFIGFSAFSLASERDTGVIRHRLIRSLGRWQLLLARFVSLNLLALVSVTLMLVLSGLVARAWWDLGPVVEDGFEIIGEQDILMEIRLGLKLALLPLPGAIAFGLLVSVLARSATQAVALAVGFVLLWDMFKSSLGDLAHYLFPTFQPALLDQSYLADVARIVRGYSDVLIDERVYLLNLWLPLPQAVALLVLALLLINRRTL